MLLPGMSVDTTEDNHLQLAKTFWLEGDWNGLIAFSEEVADCSNQAELAIYFAAAFSYQKNRDQAEYYWQLAAKCSETNISKQDCYRLLISGVHNSLARTRAINGELDKSHQHWDSALGIVVSGPQKRLAKQVRARKQLQQLGLPESWSDTSFSKDEKSSIPYKLLSELHGEYPKDPAVLIGLAESAQRQGLFGEAIGYWQYLASLLQENMPQIYYERLEEAYLDLKRYPLGQPQDEILRGVMDKHEVLCWLHKKLKPDLYFEIGVESGKSLLLAKCKAIGVDPMPKPNIPIKENHTILKMTSDSFFEFGCNEFEEKKPDFSFIDGMHLFEYALRDFINTEKNSKKSSIIVIDDIFPGSKAQAQRERRTRAWTGDVWKLAHLLLDQRKDLDIIFADVFPTGLMIIKSLDPYNKSLSLNYNELVDEYRFLNIGGSEYSCFIERKISNVVCSWEALSERFFDKKR